MGSAGCAPVLTRSDDRTGLSLCYVVGDVTSNGALVWLRAEPNSQVSLHYSQDPRLAQFFSVGPYPVEKEADYTAVIPLEKLEPATTYYYRAAVANKQAGYVARFTTAPKSDDTAKVSFCFSGDTR
jgi:phosphodiesterase/alkaline phosphatase D-like protein